MNNIDIDTKSNVYQVTIDGLDVSNTYGHAELVINAGLFPQIILVNESQEMSIKDMFKLAIKEYFENNCVTNIMVGSKTIAQLKGTKNGR